MFDFDAGKLLIIGVIALIVIGPKELPRVLRQVGQAVGRMRRMATEFQGQFMDAMKEADVQSIREEVEKLNRESQLDMRFDPVRDIRNELTQTLDQTPTSVEPAAAVDFGSEAVLPTDVFSLPPAETMTALAVEGVAGDCPPDAAAEAERGPVERTSEPAGVGQGTEPDTRPGRKRKIVLPKRRRPRTGAPHEVWNRTAPRRGRAIGLSS